MKIDFRDHVLNHFFNALARLSRCLVIVHLMLHGEVLRYVRGNGDLISQVNFVACYHHGRVRVLHLFSVRVCIWWSGERGGQGRTG